MFDEILNILKKTTVYAVVFLFLSANCLANDEKTTDTPAQKEASHNLYLSLADQHDIPSQQSQEIFNCTDKIYTVLELNSYPIGKHHLAVTWADPNGTVRENTQYEFQVRGNNSRLWAWLSLSRGFGSGMLTWANPAAGLEEFVGIWEIDVKVDGKRIGKENFEISC